MKRLTWPLLIMLTLVACSRQGPAPTNSPAPTSPATPTPVPWPTLTPAGSPVSRITIVPSATRLQPTPDSESASATGPASATTSPTSTVEPSPTPVPSSTPTLHIIDAGATATLPPTATPPDSPLPTPTPPESPLPPPPETPSPTITHTPSTILAEASATPMPTAEGEASATPTSTATATPTPSPSGADWRFENVYTYYDDEFQKFYVWGEVVNNTDSDQRLITLWPVIYDADRNPITSKEDVNAVGKGYKELREMVSLAPGLSLPFSFLVYLPDGVSVEDNYEILLEAEEAGSARGDLDILQDYSDASDWPDYFYADWPDYFYVEGIYENPGPDLTAYVALVVTLYDEEGHVIGLGWSLEEDAPYLTSGEHDFEVEVEMWGIASELRFEAYTCKMQIFGY